MAAPIGYTQSPNGFTYSTPPVANQGYYTPGLVEVTAPIGAERIPTDVPNSDGVNPATGFFDAGRFIAGGLPLSASRFYGIPQGGTPGTLLTVTGTLYAYQFPIYNTVAIKTIGLNTTTGQTGGAAHLGIYADNGAGYPGALVPTSDTGALIATSGAGVQNYTPTTPIVLTPGIYWLASIFTASSTFPTVSSTSAVYPSATNSQLGSDTAAHLVATSGQAASGISVAGTYGALPSTFTSGASLRLGADTPLVILGL